MYKIIRPFLFQLSPEKIHHIIFSFLQTGKYIPGLKYLIRIFVAYENKALERTVCGIKFPNPVGLAAGLDKNAVAYDMFRQMGFGFVEIGTVTPKPQPGNPKPRLFRLPKDKALINRMGFNNEGVAKIKKRLQKKQANIIIGGNIGKNTATPNQNAIADYEKSFNELYDYVDYFVVNVSCPNIKDLRKLQDQDSLLKILSNLKDIASKKHTQKPIFLKISPDLTFEQIDETLEIIEQTKIDGIVATNTTTTRKGLSCSEQKIQQIGNGGLSGKPLTKRSTEIIRYISQKTSGKLPIIGVGGIFSVKDALEKLDAGASLIQLYSGFIYEGPGLINKINKAIAKKTLSIC